MLNLSSLKKEEGIAFFESVRGRGDGFSASAILVQPTVAPHAGARIETRSSSSRLTKSLVAPHAGARIETYNPVSRRVAGRVAPHAGARIET